ALDHEVAGEPSPVACRASRPLLLTGRRIGLVRAALRLHPRLLGSRGGAAQPGRDRAPALPGGRRVVDSRIASGKLRRRRGTTRPLSPVVPPYRAPSIPVFASCRVATMPAPTIPA